MKDIAKLIRKAAQQAASDAVELALQRTLESPEYLDPRAAAAYLGLSKSQLDVWRHRGVGPRYTKLSQRIRYRRADLDEFMSARVRTSTAG